MTHMTAGRGLNLTGLADDHLYGKSLLTLLSLLTSLMVSFSCCLFSHEMSWMRSWTELGQFLRLFLSTLIHLEISASINCFYFNPVSRANMQEATTANIMVEHVGKELS